MRYGYFKNVQTGGTYAPDLLIRIRDEFGAIPGWEVFDDRTSTAIAIASRFVVWKVNTSEGVGNEVYVKIELNATPYFGVETWDGWNATTHVGVGERIGKGRIEHNGDSWATTDFHYAGDQDHVVFVIGPPSGIYTPTYLGLTTKLRPDVDGPKGWIMCTWYYIDGHSTNDALTTTSYSDDTKTPVLRGQNGTPRAVSRLFRTSPNFDAPSVSGGPPGPFSASLDPTVRRQAVYTYPLVLVEGNTTGGTGTGFGPRGILKSVLVQSDSYYGQYANVQPMRIGSRDYILYRSVIGANDTYSRRNSWGQYYGSGEWQMAFALPLTDWKVNCFIEGE